MSMLEQGSVTEWIVMLKAGQIDAAQPLWERYVAGLIRVAARRLSGGKRGVADEEDVVIVAFESFLRGVKEGRFTRLDDRDDLWQILVMITERKALDCLKAERAQKRGGEEKIVGDHHLQAGPSWPDDWGGISQVVDGYPTPEFAAQSADELSRLLDELRQHDPGEKKRLLQVALAKMVGYANAEIADELSQSVSSVERKLRIIRRIWSNELSDEPRRQI